MSQGSRHIGKLLGTVLMVLAYVTPGAALAGSSVALVLETSGTTLPLTQPFDQLEEDQSFHLTQDARLVFSHYSTCQTVTVSGAGKLTIGAREFSWGGSNRPDVRKEECLQTISYADPDLTPSGIGLRELGSAEIPARPRLVFPGHDAGHKFELLFKPLAPGVEELRVTLDGRSNALPHEKHLQSGTTYEVVLVKDGKASAYRPRVRIGDPSGSTGDAKPLILSFD